METLISQGVAGLASALVPLIIAAFKAFKFIHEGEKGIRLRFGRATRNRKGEPKIIEPGFVLLVPFVDTLKRHHVRQNTLECGNQRITLKDNLVYLVDALVIFRVNNIYKALFEIQHLDSSIRMLASGILRDEMTQRDHNQLHDTGEISAKLLERISEKADEWGVEFVEFKLINCAPTAESSNLINVEVGTRLRVEALKKASEKLGCNLGNMNSTLGAVLIGAPLVATATMDSGAGGKTIQQDTSKDDSSFRVEYNTEKE